METPPTERPCTACGTALRFAAHVRTGKEAPLEATPAADGILVLEPGGATYRILTPDERATWPGPRYHNHFARCPAAARFHQTGVKA